MANMSASAAAEDRGMLIESSLEILRQGFSTSDERTLTQINEIFTSNDVTVSRFPTCSAYWERRA
jgi:hypothetical protein